MASNPVELFVPANAGCIVSCKAHAVYYQAVHLDWPVELDWPGDSIQFTGSGENTNMTTRNGAITYQINPSPTSYHIRAHFQHSATGPDGPLHDSLVKETESKEFDGTRIIKVTSEDASDNDYNDTYLTLVLHPVS